MRKQKIFPVFLSWFLVIVMMVGVGLITWGMTASSEEASAGKQVSVMEISLNGVTLDEMKEGEKKTKYEGNSLTISGESFEDIEIRGRGNLTWKLAKKPWQIEFKKRTELLGISKAEKWVILADLTDNTHLRNYLARELAGMIGEKNAKQGENVEIYFDEEYEGLFYLTPKVTIDKGSVDLRDTLGVLMELDNLHDDGEKYISYGGNQLYVKGAVAEKDAEMMEKAVSEFMEDFNYLEKMAKRGNYEAVAEVADLTSFAEYFLVNEFAVNPDAYTASFYFYKDGAGDKIHAGPVWDFDLAFANYNWDEVESEDFYSPLVTMARQNEVMSGRDERSSKLIYYLMEMPEFQEEVKRVFQEKMSGKGEEFVELAREEAEFIREAVERDAEKWRYDDYVEETERLIEWVRQRFEHFEEEYGEN